uniref:Uncharacterized protein n=1 Tax=Ixodes ricinus TaxID=34613 RepID=A0A6B0UFQ8_IXORI
MLLPKNLCFTSNFTTHYKRQSLKCSFILFYLPKQENNCNTSQTHNSPNMNYSHMPLKKKNATRSPHTKKENTQKRQQNNSKYKCAFTPSVQSLSYILLQQYP